MSDAVASKSAGVVAQADVDVAEISLAVIDAVRMQDSLGRAGEIVVERWQWFLRVESAGAEQAAQEFLVFRVDAENGIW